MKNIYYRNLDHKICYNFVLKLFSLRPILPEIYTQKNSLAGNKVKKIAVLPAQNHFFVVSRKLLAVQRKVIYKTCREFYGLHFVIDTFPVAHTGIEVFSEEVTIATFWKDGQ